MTKSCALRLARQRISCVYRVAASRQAGVTYGFNFYQPGQGTRTINSSSDYRAAVAHRAEALAELADALRG